MSHGFTGRSAAAFSDAGASCAGISTNLDRGLDRHARAQQMLWVLSLIETNANRETLDNLYVISAGVLRRKQTEQRSRGSRKILDGASIVAIVRVDVYTNRLPYPHPLHLSLFKVGGYPDIVQRHDHEQALSGLYAMPEFYSFSSNDTGYRAIDFRIAEI